MKRVLVIEDKLPRLKLLAWGLGDAGYQVTVAQTIGQAFELLQTADVEAIVINTDSPIDAKAQAIERMRELEPGVRVVDISETDKHDTGADACVPAQGSNLNDILEALDPPRWDE